ncbi:hypothetical protein Hanom_Chr03g00224741 [Helianthus anomalus]
MNKILQVHMSWTESNNLSEERDPMKDVSDDEIASFPEISTSDFETDPEMITDDDDLDDVLALPLPLRGQLIIGHPDGKHLV